MVRTNKPRSDRSTMCGIGMLHQFSRDLRFPQEPW
jgi:hypothetical protein